MKKNYLKSFLIALLIIAFGSIASFVFINQDEQCEPCNENEERRETGHKEPDLFQNYYYPQTFEEVANERYQYLLEHGSFEGLRNNSNALGKIKFNEWENIGPFGVTACSVPGERNDYNYSGRIISLGQDWGNPDIMYLGAASGGLWKSTDRGVTWSNIFDDLSNPSVGTIATNPKLPGEVWIGTGNKGNGPGMIGAPSIGLVYRSTDYGNTWQQIVFSTVTPNVVNKVLIRPKANNSLPDVIFIATDIGLFRSENLSDWTLVLNGNYSDVVYIGSIFDQNYKIVAAKRINGNGGLWYSNDKGNSYVQRILPGSPGNLARITLTSSIIGYHQKVYANVATSNGQCAGIWKSTDGGDNWVMVTDPYLPDIVGQMNNNNTILVEDDIINGNTVYTGADRRALVKSTNGGNSWSASDHDTTGGILGKIHEDQQFILDDVSITGTIYVANDGGLYKSTDRGKTFHFWGNNFLSISQIYNLSVSPEPGGLYDGLRYYIATQDDGVQRGPNEFLEWFGLTCCDGIDVAFKDQTNYNIIVTGNQGGANRVQYISSAGPCEPWGAFTQGLPNGNFFGGQLIFNGNHFYFKSGVNSILYRAQNGVLPWASLQNFNAAIDAINATPENRVVAGIQNTIPVRISNLDNTIFTSPTNPSSFWQSKRVTDISFGKLIGSSTRDIYVSLSGTNGIRIARSTNNGESFVDATGDLSDLVNVRSILVDPTNDNVVYIGSDFGVYVSFNRGTNWQNFSENLPAVCYVNDLEFDFYSTKIVAATYGRGVFISDRAVVSVEDEINPRSFTLYNNYPNPFNPSTTIKYQLNEYGFVSLKIYDALGREVSTLVNEEKPSGEYIVNFDASNLASGTYFYTLKTSKHSETKKMILLK